MQNFLTTIAHILTSAFVIAYAAYLGIRHYRRRLARILPNAAQRALDIKDQKEHIAQLFKQLNIETEEWKEDTDSHSLHFNYQDGHFNLELSKEDIAPRIMFLFFYDCPVDDLDDVRIVVNQCNLNSIQSRMAYTIDDREATVNVHLMCPMRITQHTTSKQLSEALDEIFAWRNSFYRRIAQQNTRHHTGGLTADPEKVNADDGQVRALLHDQLIAGKPAFGPQYYSPTLCPSIDMVMTHAFGMPQYTPISLDECVEGKAVRQYQQAEAGDMEEMSDWASLLNGTHTDDGDDKEDDKDYDKEGDKEDGEEGDKEDKKGDKEDKKGDKACHMAGDSDAERIQLQSYSLLTAFLDADDKPLPDVRHATLCFRFNDTGNRPRQLDITLLRMASTQHTDYLRVNAILNPPADSWLDPIEFSFTQPVVKSLCIGFDRMPPEQQTAKLRYLWKEAVEAQRQGLPAPTDENGRPVVYHPETPVFDSIYWGSSLFHQKRFAECIEPLRFAFSRLNDDVYYHGDDKNTNMGTYLAVCRMLAFAYAELKRNEEAIYFIEIISMGPPRIVEHDEFLHLLLSVRDARLVPVISNLEGDLLNHLRDYQRDDDDDDDDDNGDPDGDGDGDDPYNDMVCLLGITRLYKAHVLADKGKTDEAEQVLQTVPGNKRLASRVKETREYIERKRNERGKRGK